MTALKKSLLGLSVTLALSACGGGGGGDTSTAPSTPTVSHSLTGKISGQYDAVEVRLMAGEKQLDSITIQNVTKTNGTSYSFNLTNKMVNDTTPLHLDVLEVVLKESNPATTKAASEVESETALYTINLGTRAALIAADSNENGIITAEEESRLYLTATTSLLTAFQTGGHEDFNTIVQRIGREKFNALNALVHALNDSVKVDNTPVLLKSLVPNADKILSDEYLLSLVDLITPTDAEPSVINRLLAAIEGDLPAAPQPVEAPKEDTTTEAVATAKSQAADTPAMLNVPELVRTQVEAKAKYFKDAPYSDSARLVLDNTYPRYSLTLKGEVLDGLRDPQVSLQIGNYHNDPYAPDYFNYANKPKTPYLLPIELDGLDYETIDLDGTAFRFEFALRDNQNTMYTPENCKPIAAGTKSYKARNYRYDEVQDLLTLVVYDRDTGTEMRSVLGSMCELLPLANKGVLTPKELPALNVTLEQAAHAILLERSAHETSTANYFFPTSLKSIQETFAKHSQDNLEFMMTIIAMQITGAETKAGIVPDSADDFHNTAALIMGVDKSGGYRNWIKGDAKKGYADMLLVFNQLTQINDVYVGMRELDMDLPELITDSAKRIAGISQFTSDKQLGDELVAKINRDESWLPEVPKEGIDIICSAVVADDQIRGIALRGQGEGWLTIGWDKYDSSSEYTLHWDTQHFDRPSQAANSVTVEKPIATIENLTEYQTYYFAISHNGTPSVTFPVRKGDMGLNTQHLDTNNVDCDQTTGLAVNSHINGQGAMSFLKVGTNGDRLYRQDLNYQSLPFACVNELKHGRTWAIMNAEEEDGDRIRHWMSIDNRYVNGSGLEIEDNKFNGFCVTKDGDVIRENLAESCNTEMLVKMANEAAHCGVTDWRVPTFAELDNLRLNKDGLFDDNFFPGADDGRTYWLSGNNPNHEGHGTTVHYKFRPKATITNNASPQQVMLVSDGLKITNQ
ncbi:DUF1566 domain-containing protein [Thaumasiovibrio subtropicus]|uniref:DUF1566 domain-containing protein n=1 Tax=Thaumasiovibrio subtropicus TaxID=1891207 RepID=UPI000B358534|nr:DUF1566 domain-containing protein [Thaumasiovibrio subtropicus]